VDCEYILNYVPIKILTEVYSLTGLKNGKYVSQVQYLEIKIDADAKLLYSWDIYQEILGEFVNLKAIAFKDVRSCQDFIKFTLPNLNHSTQKIWNDRFSYFKSLGIEILSGDDIHIMQTFFKKIVKEEGVSWGFHIY